MFGYVRPVKDKLSEEQYLRFRSVYCGLCHVMDRQCGAVTRFSINYDFTFLAMLLSSTAQPCYTCRRCVAHPIKKRSCLSEDPALTEAADYSVILSWWKLRDVSTDEGFFKMLAARLAGALMKRGYKKAVSRKPEFAASVEENIRALSVLEQERSPSVDKTADRFALILAAASEGEKDQRRRRVLEQLLYHTGRLIYIMDALDDLPEDFKQGRYNPLKYRFSLKAPVLDVDQLESLERTARHSINLCASAFQLLEPGPWTDILTNIIYMGIPAMGAQLLQRYLATDKSEDGDKT